ncbi:RING finger domain-containing protein [Endozoicomonas sp. SESOKO2]|uniref:RING finger domain-containing protein n=1 Tax=Endozoicomonas sp. SESOKO2 TaxID=2828743 RepID=UPI002149353A|nr:RING finger domain-containing protein [Endozoicomonas sp. SESOKO2]
MDGITPPGSPNNRLPYQQETDNCSVCLEPFARRAVTVLEQCRHMFHEDCLETWLLENTTCPYCRTIVREREVQPAPDEILNSLLRSHAVFSPDGQILNRSLTA